MAISTTLWQLGQTAGTLVTLPNPDPEIDRSLQRIGGAAKVGLNGAQTQDTYARKRTWQINWTAMTDTEADLVAQFWDGRKGLGPFVLNDPTGAGLQTSVNVTNLTDVTIMRDSTGVGWRNLALQLAEV